MFSRSGFYDWPHKNCLWNDWSIFRHLLRFCQCYPILRTTAQMRFTALPAHKQRRGIWTEWDSFFIYRESYSLFSVCFLEEYMPVQKTFPVRGIYRFQWDQKQHPLKRFPGEWTDVVKKKHRRHAGFGVSQTPNRNKG